MNMTRCWIKGYLYTLIGTDPNWPKISGQMAKIARVSVLDQKKRIQIYGIKQNKQSRAIYERLKKKLRPLKKHSQKIVFGNFFLNIPILHIVNASYQF